MFIPEELVDIIKRIGSGTHTEADLQRLGQMFGVTIAAGERSVAINRDDNGASITTGDGNTIINIVFQADGLRIGEKDYHGDGAELLRSLLQTILQPNIDYLMASKRSVTSIIKKFSLLHCLLLVFIFTLFASIALTIPESAVSVRVVISMIGSISFFAIIKSILSNAIYLQRANQETNSQSNKLSLEVRELTANSMFDNTININNRNEFFVSLMIGTIFGITLFFLSTSHYLFYIVDNSGSMGTCPNWTSEKGCPQPLLSPDKSTVKYVTKHLNKMFEADKSLGSIEVSKSSLPIFPFYKFTSDVKVGLIEIGGKTSLNRQCSVNELAEPVLKNQKQLLEGLTKIKANDDGATALIQSLKKADYSINLKTSNPLKYAASKNVILFTDSYEDNCGGKQINFCEAASELPEGFDVKLNVYGISDTNTGKKFPCDKFKCGEKYSGQICQETPVDKIKQSSIPKLGLVLSLSPTLTTISYTSLVLSLICIALVLGMILKYREELSNTYPKQVYSFLDSSNKKIEKVKYWLSTILQNFCGKNKKYLVLYY